MNQKINIIEELNSIITQAMDNIQELTKQMFGRHEKVELIKEYVDELEMIKNDAIVELLRLRLDKVKEEMEVSKGDDL